MADKNPVPTPEEKQALSDALIEQMQAVNEAQMALSDYRSALGAQFAEVGNSDKMQYTDRETGEVRLWGISDAVMTREQKKADEAIERVKAALKL